MMNKYEIKFHTMEYSSDYISAQSHEDASELAVKNNNDRRSIAAHVSLDDIVYCEKTNKIKLDDICDPYIQAPHNSNNVELVYLENILNQITKYGNLILEPDFQRHHVWKEHQQIAYMEHLLRGGKSGREIFFNCPRGWDDINDRAYDTVLVDGLQRLTAVRKFMNGKLKVFDGNYNVDSFTHLNSVDLLFITNDIVDEKEVLKWYLQMNSGGTPHTEDELNKVRKMISCA